MALYRRWDQSVIAKRRDHQLTASGRVWKSGKGIAGFDCRHHDLGPRPAGPAQACRTAAGISTLDPQFRRRRLHHVHPCAAAPAWHHRAGGQAELEYGLWFQQIKGGAPEDHISESAGLPARGAGRYHIPRRAFVTTCGVRPALASDARRCFPEPYSLGDSNAGLSLEGTTSSRAKGDAGEQRHRWSAAPVMKLGGAPWSWREEHQVQTPRAVSALPCQARLSRNPCPSCEDQTRRRLRWRRISGSWISAPGPWPPTSSSGSRRAKRCAHVIIPGTRDRASGAGRTIAARECMGGAVSSRRLLRRLQATSSTTGDQRAACPVAQSGHHLWGFHCQVSPRGAY